MNILEELNAILSKLPVLVETGVFSGKPPDEYCILTPLVKEYGFFADNRPQVDIHDVRITIYSKGNYLLREAQITNAVLDADFTVTDRHYITHEDDTGFHSVAIEVAKYYPMKE